MPMPNTINPVNPWKEDPSYTRSNNRGYWKLFYDKAINAGYSPDNAREFADENNKIILDKWYGLHGTTTDKESIPIQSKPKAFDKIQKIAMPLVLGGVTAGLTAKGIDYLFEQRNKKEKTRREQMLRNEE